VVFPSFKIRTSQFSKCGSIRASLAIEQQTSQTKVALLRIGTRGRYSTLPFIIMLSIMSIYCNGVSLYDKFTGVLKIFNSEFSERTTSSNASSIMTEMKTIPVLLLEILLSKQKGFTFCSKM